MAELNKLQGTEELKGWRYMFSGAKQSLGSMAVYGNSLGEGKEKVVKVNCLVSRL